MLHLKLLTASHLQKIKIKYGEGVKFRSHFLSVTLDFQAVPLSTQTLTADRRQLPIYLREFCRNHYCLLKYKENSSSGFTVV